MNPWSSAPFHRIVIHARSAVLAASALLFLPTRQTTRAAPPVIQLVSLHGIVRDTVGRPLSWVQIWCDEGRRRAQQTGSDGRFRFDDVRVAPCTVTATLLGTPESGPKPDVTKKLTPDGTELTLVVDRGAELRVTVEGTRFPGAETTKPTGEVDVSAGGARLRSSGGGFFTSQSMSYGATSLHLETKEGRLAYSAAVDNGVLAFRRVHAGSLWTLFIAWSESTKGTYFGSGTSLVPGATSVTLEPGRAITGTAKLPLPPSMWAGPPRDTVMARRGPVSVDGWVDARSGTFGFSPLPSGPWTVTLRSGGKQATVEVEAGSTVALDPK